MWCPAVELQGFDQKGPAGDVTGNRPNEVRKAEVDGENPMHADIYDFAGILRAAEEAREEFGSRPWYRGQCLDRPDWKLRPSIYRTEYTRRREKGLLQDFMIRAGSRYENCPREDQPGKWLALMQHHRLPTRLLDWTESILVATFHAVRSPTGSEAEGDGAIWALYPRKLNEVAVQDPSFYLLSGDFVRQKLLTPAFKGEEGSPATLAVLAHEVHPRMMAQQSVFTIHGSLTPLEEMQHHDEFLMKIGVVHQNAKAKIREDLRDLGIRLGVLPIVKTKKRSG